MSVSALCYVVYSGAIRSLFHLAYPILPRADDQRLYVRGRCRQQVINGCGKLLQRLGLKQFAQLGRSLNGPSASPRLP